MPGGREGIFLDTAYINTVSLDLVAAVKKATFTSWFYGTDGRMEIPSGASELVSELRLEFPVHISTQVFYIF